ELACGCEIPLHNQCLPAYCDNVILQGKIPQCGECKSPLAWKDSGKSKFRTTLWKRVAVSIAKELEQKAKETGAWCSTQWLKLITGRGGTDVVVKRMIFAPCPNHQKCINKFKRFRWKFYEKKIEQIPLFVGLKDRKKKDILFTVQTPIL